VPRNGSGVYSLPELPFQPNTTISSAAVNDDLSDIATALTFSVATDGQSSMTGPLKLPSGSAAAPALAFSADQTTGLRHGAAGTMTVVGGASDVVTFDGTQIGASGNLLTYGNGAVLQPVGAVTSFAGAAAPTGWQLCAGQVLAQASYPELFTQCGSTYNTGGEGAGNFRLPDCRGRMLAGKDNMGGTAANRITVAGGNFDGTVLGNTGGAQNHILLIAEIPAHSHTASVTDTGHLHNCFGGDAGSGAPGVFDISSQNSGINRNTDLATTGISVSNANTGGGGAHTILSPTIIFNTIIFAGRP
jgi:microcystin-dependent protein